MPAQDEITFDLTRNTGLISEGMHLLKVEKAEPKISGSQNPMIALTLVCQDQGDDQGKKMFHFLTLTDSARFKVDELLDAIKAPKTGTMSSGQFVGKVFKAMVIHREYNDNMNANIHRAYPADFTGNPPIPTLTQNSSNLPSDVSNQSSVGKSLF